MESVSWTDTGDTNVNVSVVTPEVDVKVSCFVFKSHNLHYLNFKDILSYSVEYHIGGEIISVLA